MMNLLLALLQKKPVAVVLISASWIQTFIDWTLPVIQLLLALLGVVLAYYNIQVKRQELRRLKEGSEGG